LVGVDVAMMVNLPACSSFVSASMECNSGAVGYVYLAW
jgi:hypothetical protein